MTNSNLISAVAKELGVSRVSVSAVLDVLVTTLVSSFQNGEGANVTNLGRFKVIEKAARTARNPRTGEPIQVLAKRVLKFSPTKGLKKF